MNKFRFTIKLLAIATFLFAFASMAQAQASRTWVSGVGDDANPCSRTAPCKTFAGAISKTAPGGEIDALDPGGFGAVTITKGMTIDGGGGQVASVLVSGTNGIVVSAGASDVIILRHLRINGIGTGLSGIRFIAGGALTVENCFIFGFTNKGIDVALTANGSNVDVRNTTIENCKFGIGLITTSGIVQGNFNNVRIDQPTAAVPNSAIELGTGAIAVIRGSYITRYQIGINVTGAAASSAGAIVLGTTIFNTTTGVAVGNTTLRMEGSALTNNTTGVSLAGGTFHSGCDNFLDGNTTDVSGGAITNACTK